MGSAGVPGGRQIVPAIVQALYAGDIAQGVPAGIENAYLGFLLD